MAKRKELIKLSDICKLSDYSKRYIAIVEYISDLENSDLQLNDSVSLLVTDQRFDVMKLNINLPLSIVLNALREEKRELENQFRGHSVDFK